jgi:hypothetical protein
MSIAAPSSKSAYSSSPALASQSLNSDTDLLAERSYSTPDTQGPRGNRQRSVCYLGAIAQGIHTSVWQCAQRRSAMMPIFGCHIEIHYASWHLAGGPRSPGDRRQVRGRCTSWGAVHKVERVPVSIRLHNDNEPRESLSPAVGAIIRIKSELVAVGGLPDANLIVSRGSPFLRRCASLGCLPALFPLAHWHFPCCIWFLPFSASS